MIWRPTLHYPTTVAYQALPAPASSWQGLAGNYGRIVECGSPDHLPRWYDAPGVISTLLQLGGWCSEWLNTQSTIGCPCQHPCQLLAGSWQATPFLYRSWEVSKHARCQKFSHIISECYRYVRSSIFSLIGWELATLARKLIRGRKRSLPPPNPMDCELVL